MPVIFYEYVQNVKAVKQAVLTYEMIQKANME